MAGLLNASDLQSLSNLLNQGGGSREDLSDEELSGSHKNKKAPENPRFKVNIRRVGPEDSCAEPSQSKGSGDSTVTDTKWNIWDEDEVPTTDTLPDDATLDPRIVPEYDIMYQQAVTSEDIYLQMGNKTPSTVSCEDMLVTIQLPGETRDSVDCDLTAQHMDIRSVKYRLSLPLPHPVLPHLSQANWDSDKFELKLILRLSRELDFINF